MDHVRNPKMIELDFLAAKKKLERDKKYIKIGRLKWQHVKIVIKVDSLFS
ncbi:unnamed protein product [marine sediment metagenome]|uniref:Uncharacterized protein n=1 Tax=marine sediment metagenome TaxID=412755 RepID=X1CUV7_9ZZZZ